MKQFSKKAILLTSLIIMIFPVFAKGYKEASSANDKSVDVFYQECECYASFHALATKKVSVTHYYI